jgi:hypothetical protein
MISDRQAVTGRGIALESHYSGLGGCATSATQLARDGTGTRPQARVLEDRFKNDDHDPDLGRSGWTGRRESNPDQLGRSAAQPGI